MAKKIVECVPNFSEGRRQSIIAKISKQIDLIDGVKLLDVDMGYDTNRTVITFAGTPNEVVLAAFNAIKRASELIDMSKHKGEHLRMGATDVCPIIPVSNISMEECIELSKKLGKKIAKELSIPVFLYEKSASNKSRINLANIRSGEYEGMSQKIKEVGWCPDFGESEINKSAGVTAVGAREFLIAYNVNLNTKDKKKASDIALDIREQGRAKRDSDGKIIRDSNNNIIKVPGKFKNVKAVGWYIEEYGRAQVSVNLTNYRTTSMHEVFEEIRMQANKRGLRVTGSEIVGLIPKEAIVSSGKYFLKKQNESIAVPESDIIQAAVNSLGLNDISLFDSSKMIIEDAVIESDNFINKKMRFFLDELSRKKSTPGGGCVSALSGALSCSLVAMAINFSKYSSALQKNGDKVQFLRNDFIDLVQKDADAFSFVMKAFSLPRKNEEQKNKRIIRIQESYKVAIEPPLSMLIAGNALLKIMSKVFKDINMSCISDFGVGIEMIRSSINGALMNININLKEISDDQEYVKLIEKKIDSIKKSNKKLFYKLDKGVII
ncbi:MAG: glutamate formimidoyltransferase [Candidatus Marinimicrobia bacterium]|nr:glutamate formimidoyltransferase [Candidatus Neomarinimicrobiota bacterium]|tara:strand:+ start:2730 stop:4376 length:1647 start_codon:yes stop_codon:yes gene_type:complete